jgi:hypothetical protein
MLPVLPTGVDEPGQGDQRGCEVRSDAFCSPLIVGRGRLVVAVARRRRELPPIGRSASLVYELVAPLLECPRGDLLHTLGAEAGRGERRCWERLSHSVEGVQQSPMPQATHPSAARRRPADATPARPRPCERRPGLLQIVSVAVAGPTSVPSIRESRPATSDRWGRVFKRAQSVASRSVDRDELEGFVAAFHGCFAYGSDAAHVDLVVDDAGLQWRGFLDEHGVA